MPIYSRNRVGATVSANESYTDHDLGRILYEDVINTDRVFNAALARDFQEVASRANGTMLESELTAFQEFSVKEAWKNLKAQMKKLWEKIKGVFRTTFAKLTTWLVRDGKAFVAMHRKNILGKNVSKCEIPKYRMKQNWEKVGTSMQKAAKSMTIENALKEYQGYRGSDGPKPDDFTKEAITKVLGTSCDIGEFKDKFMDLVFGPEQTDIEFGKLGVTVDKLFSNISKPETSVKDLKKAEKEADKHLKSLIKKLDDYEKKDSNFEKDDLGDGYHDKQSRDGVTYSRDSYKAASAVCSANSTFLSTLTSAQIAAVKFSIKQDRMVVGKLAAYNPAKNESAMLETMAWLEGADDFDTQDSIDPDSVNDEDVAGDPDVQVIINVEDDE